MRYSLHDRGIRWWIAGLMLWASVGHAQGSAAPIGHDPRVALVGSIGPTVIPDAFSLQCGRNSGGSGHLALDAGLAALVRPWRTLVVQADLRTTPAKLSQGCTLVLFPVDTAYRSADRRDPFRLSTVRVGLETPRRYPLVRVTAGVGRLWGAPTRSISTAGLAVGTRSRVRVLAEFDVYRSRVDADEVTNNFAVPGTSSRRPIVLRPIWTSWRAGVEVPLRR